MHQKDARDFEIDRLRAAIERLRAALKPFADAWTYREEPAGYTFMSSDYQRAADAYNSKGDG